MHFRFQFAWSTFSGTMEIIFLSMMVQRHVLITPSILSADFGRLQEEVESVERYADWLQIDVMDGHFVPNISFGVPVVRCLRTKLPLDVHLMVTNPLERIGEFLEVGAKNITFHVEAVQEKKAQKHLFRKIRKGGARVGIALNPSTSLSVIRDVISEVDLVLIMSVHPGFSGQKFIPGVLKKVSVLRAQYPSLMIQVDGGIDVRSAKLCRDAGADNLVAASAIFHARDRRKAIRALRGEV